MRRPPKAPEPVARPVPESDAVPTAWERATPEQRAWAAAVVEGLRKDLAAFFREKRRAGRL